MIQQPDTYFCEKCDYYGPASEHQGCEYLAIDVNWQQKEIAALTEVITLSEDHRLMDEYIKLENDHKRQATRIKELEQDIQTTADALAEVEQIRLGLQNVRLFAARHRKEDWALMILGFCAEAGEVGSITR